MGNNYFSDQTDSKKNFSAYPCLAIIRPVHEFRTKKDPDNYMPIPLLAGSKQNF